MQENGAVKVLSFDLDGCLFNNSYYYGDNGIAGSVIRANAELFATISREIKQGNFARAKAFIGSARQDINLEKLNSIKAANHLGRGMTGVETLPIIAQHLQESVCNIDVSYDALYLADVYHENYAGHAFVAASQYFQTHPIKKEANGTVDQSVIKGHTEVKFYDETKSSILYAQIHKSAIDAKDKPVSFDFYDDREDILKALSELYNERKDLIPRKVTLNLYRYKDGVRTLYASITGAGFKDYYFSHTIRTVAEKAEEKGITTELASTFKTFKPHITLPNAGCTRFGTSITGCRPSRHLAEPMHVSSKQSVIMEDRVSLLQ